MSQARQQLEEERRVLVAFVSKFDSLTSSGLNTTSLIPKFTGPAASFQRQQQTGGSLMTIDEGNSPFRLDANTQPSLLEEQMHWDGLDDESFEMPERPSSIKNLKRLHGAAEEEKDEKPVGFKKRKLMPEASRNRRYPPRPWTIWQG